MQLVSKDEWYVCSYVTMDKSQNDQYCCHGNKANIKIELFLCGSNTQIQPFWPNCEKSLLYWNPLRSDDASAIFKLEVASGFHPIQNHIICNVLKQ